MSQEKEWDDIDPKEITVLSRWFWGTVIFAVGVFLYCVPRIAGAEEIPLHVLDKNGIVIQLMGTECVDPISLALVKESYRPRLKAIKSVWPERDGSLKAYIGCWMDLTKEEAGGEESFLLVFEDQQHGVVPKSEFKKAKGQSGA